MKNQKIKKSKICCVCGVLCGGFLCDTHRKRYIFYPDHNIIALKPRRKISKLQTTLFKVAREVFKEPVFQEAVFPFLIFYRYDIAIPSLKLILEADGRQHSSYVPFFHKNKEGFKRSQTNDKMKENVAKENGWEVIRFTYKEKEADMIKRLQWKKKKIKK